MAKDYFQDILPPDDAQPRKTARPAENSNVEETRIPINNASSASAAMPEDDGPAAAERSIRNISVQRKSRPTDMREPMSGVMVSPPRKGGGKWLLWTGAVASIAVLGILLLVALRSTTVDVTPRAQKITFDAASQFTAYPAESAASGTLAYTAHTLDLEDSEVVASQGTVHAEEKATGTITVYNAFQTSPFKLVKNTRFESGGLIFRTPADVVIPGMKGTAPGQITITVIADQPGEQYNIAPSKFNVPGLKGGASYSKIYAQSTDAFTGGFKGDRPGVSDSDKAAALAAVRTRLESKARSSIENAADGMVVLPDLVEISYTEEPATPEAGGSVRLHEKAHVTIPAFTADQFAAVVGGASGISDTAISFVPGSDFTAQILNASTTSAGQLQFSLGGSATMVWKVDTAALQKALAGKPQAAFQDIVKQFPGIQEAHARVEPFWRSSFPADPTSIKVTVGQVKAQ